jgi:hypothetical protein
MKRGQQQYQVVQEGTASTAVTSNIVAPGETATVAAETNIDTTTNFSLGTDTTAVGSDTAGASSTNPIYPAQASSTTDTATTVPPPAATTGTRG